VFGVKTQLVLFIFKYKPVSFQSSKLFTIRRDWFIIRKKMVRTNKEVIRNFFPLQRSPLDRYVQIIRTADFHRKKSAIIGGEKSYIGDDVFF